MGLLSRRPIKFLKNINEHITQTLRIVSTATTLVFHQNTWKNAYRSRLRTHNW